MALKVSPMEAAKTAIESIGLGYDIATDLRLKFCKRDLSDPCLIELDDGQGRDIVLPGGISIPNVSKSIKCDKGERMRFRSDVLSFQQMSEQFNQEISLSGKIPSGLFNAMFEFTGCWQKDQANTKTLAFDGWFITLYTVALAKSQTVLRDHVKQDVPSSWDPAALASFIQRYGTHIIVGVKMGGKDIVYLKQQHSSNLQPAEVQKRLKEMADKRFLDANEQYSMGSEEPYVKDKSDNREIRLRFADSSPSMSYANKEDIIGIYKRRGGSDFKKLPHSDWLNSVTDEPDVISMSFVPITSLLNGVPGSGFLSHAINLYLRYKPPIEDLHQFLEFQLPRQWAPVFGELTLGPQQKQQSSASLQFSFLGPKLFVNTSPVDVGQRPVTGLRLFLEGKRSNRLAIHLQHLSSLPKTFQLCDDPYGNSPLEPDRKYFEPVQWKNFSHVCTAPVESYDEHSIITGAQFRVSNYGLKKILFLHLHFSTILGASVVKNHEWDGSPGIAQKSGIMSMLISGHFTAPQKPPPRPADVNINSAVYPGGPPVPVQAPKLLKFVDTTEMTRGPQNTPGYWVVSGARLLVEKGKISLKVKYSLLAVMPPDDDEV
ncbi:MACPF domain-containing protein At4g24290 [Magnolia sinica]|uniref:MACPF domain-containing protein At4g24290 n=1 Tax=Magnolia sinica TaxID=86752 RepID=UPI002659DF95|nr:MACPF domain-containing protein At4g24290 [Magnolia sinica]XP_058090155.1 MACPF domain-containing protein At4g24290 [Magnolia sinica]XP_058090156.1 MACPF domain-containing protein At4g24290 [Magnolia sinica]XP_058090157.1 MACPF domain-containing protein At4g24290 [Magnolia sinica]